MIFFIGCLQVAVLVPMLEAYPNLKAVTLLEYLQRQYTLLEYLQRQYPGQYSDSIRRTLERRVK